jgi:electron transport complex protein RnfB
VISLADALEDALPQTQCTRCGYPDCRGYAEAIAAGDAAIDRCPPGGAEGIARLARLTGRAAGPLDPACGTEGPRRLAVIDEAECIGCTLCQRACPVDCIVGAAKTMHTVAAPLCTGCELCVPACPVDCIALVDASDGRSGWAAWSDGQARQARERYARHRARTARGEFDALETQACDDTGAPAERKRAVLDAVLARARARAQQRGDDTADR